MTEFVITLVANPAKQKLDLAQVHAAGRHIAARGGTVHGQHWLAADAACDIIFSTRAPDAIHSALSDMLADAPIDAVLQPLHGRCKRVLIADMDSTMITIECIDELADFIGLKPQIAAITERAMNGELNFETALRERVALLRGLPESALQKAYDTRVTYTPGARALVATMRKHGAHCLLVSGGFTFFTSRVRETLGFHDDYSNTLEIKDGELTGRVIPPILGKEAKLEMLIETCRAHQLDPMVALAVGDGANDLPMLLAAGMGVAYHAKPVVQKAAKACINHCDLTALLYIQGYSQGDIVSG